jgi:hypothetical protein
MTSLALELVDLAYRHPPYPDSSQSILNFLHLGRINHRFDLFHWRASLAWL